jgi:chromosome segregation ATPase
MVMKVRWVVALGVVVVGLVVGVVVVKVLEGRVWVGGSGKIDRMLVQEKKDSERRRRELAEKMREADQLNARLLEKQKELEAGSGVLDAQIAELQKQIAAVREEGGGGGTRPGAPPTLEEVNREMERVFAEKKKALEFAEARIVELRRKLGEEAGSQPATRGVE